MAISLLQQSGWLEEGKRQKMAKKGLCDYMINMQFIISTSKKDKFTQSYKINT